MILYIQDYDTEKVLFETCDVFAVPNAGEEIYIKNVWYKVKSRSFYFNDEGKRGSSCSLFVREIKD